MSRRIYVLNFTYCSIALYFAIIIVITIIIEYFNIGASFRGQTSGHD